MIQKSLILQIVTISVILFILVNYLISSKHDKIVIDDIIDKVIDSNENIDEDDIYDMERIKAKYLKEKFRVYITRGIVFGVVLFFVMSYMSPANQIQSDMMLMTDIAPQIGQVSNVSGVSGVSGVSQMPYMNRPIIPNNNMRGQLPNVPTRSRFFNDAPW